MKTIKNKTVSLLTKKNLLPLLAVLIVMFTSISCGEPKNSLSTSTKAKVSVSDDSGETGYIYVDGIFGGEKSPGIVQLKPGKHTIGITLEKSFQYRRQVVNVTRDMKLAFTAADKPTPKTWKALWIGISEVTGVATSGTCSSRFSKEELDAGYDFFNWSIQNHFEKFSYGVMKWNVQRKDLTKPVTLTKGNDANYTISQSTISAAFPEIIPGAYDCIFVFWREAEGTCSFRSSYFGLAFTNPLAEESRTGFLQVKFDVGPTTIDKKIAEYKTTDPGVWTHEWLHTVGEKFYQSRGLLLPEKASDGLVVHSASMYGYKSPWIEWYADFIAGRVLTQSGKEYCGIGLDALLDCSLKEAAKNNCPQ